MNTRKYLTLTRAGMIEALQFKGAIFSIIIGNLVYLIMIYFLWKAIFASVDTTTVNGMTFEDTMIYLVLASALFYFMEMYLVWEMGSDIQSGKIILDIIKPMKYPIFKFFQLSGNFIMFFFITFLPTFIVVYIVTYGAIHLDYNILFFLVSVLLGLLINYFIDFFIGTICLYTESIWGINIMKEVIVLLLSGATIPIVFFPEPLKTVVYYLPFQAIYNSPLRLLIDYSMPFSERIEILGIQLFWLIIMILVSGSFWKISLKRITINGG